MKKGFISFIIILLFAGFIFYLGFVSFRVPVGKYGVMTSKTSGVYQKIIENENSVKKLSKIGEMLKQYPELNSLLSNASASEVLKALNDLK